MTLQRRSLRSAPAVLNTADKAAWVTGWNEAVDAMEAEQAQAMEPATGERVKVGDSRFESWYGEAKIQQMGTKQRCREAYEAGLNEAQQVAVPDGEGWYGHKFKEGTRGIWRCDCGKQLTDGENKCTNGTQNTLQSQPLTADAEDTQTHADTYPEREAHALSIPEVVSHEAQQVAVPVPLTDGEIDAVTIAQWGEMHGQPLAAHRAFARAIEARLGVHPQGDT